MLVEESAFETVFPLLSVTAHEAMLAVDQLREAVFPDLTREGTAIN